MSVEVLRDFSLGINFVEIVILLEIFLYFIMGYRKYKAEGGVPDIFTLIAAFGFLAGAIARGFYIIYDYYTLDNFYKYIAWIFLAVCLFLIVSSLFKGVTGEIFKEFPHKKLYGVSVLIFAATVVIARFFSTMTFYIVIIIVGVILLIPLIYQFNQWIKKVGGYIKRYFTIASCALPLCFVGIAIGALWGNLPEFEGWILKITAHCIFLGSLSLFAIAMWSLPSLSEFNWEEQVKTLYVIMPGGLLAYEFSFKSEDSVDSDLLGSGLSGIVDIVREMTGSVKRMKIIRQEKKNIYLEYGDHVTVAIIAEEELKILFEKISRFTREFETLFADVLESWDGNTEIFKLADSLVKKIFISARNK